MVAEAHAAAATTQNEELAALGARPHGVLDRMKIPEPGKAALGSDTFKCSRLPLGSHPTGSHLC